MEVRHHLFQRITVNPAVCFGKPCIRGMRMPVSSILDYLAGGMTPEEVLQDFPFLEKADIFEALAFSSAMLQETFIPYAKAA